MTTCNIERFKYVIGKYGLSYEVDSNYRIVLKGMNDEACEHFQEIIRESPDIEAELILELAEQDENLMCCIEERAAIRSVEGLPDDLYSAVMCNIRREE